MKISDTMCNKMCHSPKHISSLDNGESVQFDVKKNSRVVYYSDIFKWNIRKISTIFIFKRVTPQKNNVDYYLTFDDGGTLIRLDYCPRTFLCEFIG